ncbi:type VI secretion system tip protein VgrG, partial [Dyella monticola]
MSNPADVARNFHQHYFLDIPSLASAAALSIQTFKVREQLGGLYHITVTLSHPDELARGDLIGKDAMFRIVDADGALRRFAGSITGFSRLQRSKDDITYWLTINPHVARLDGLQASRIFQKQTTPQIIEAILRRHGFKGHQFAFTLRRSYPQHAFRLQHHLSDWNYIRLLMKQEGIYCYSTQGEHGDVLIFVDDIDHYIYQPTLTLPYREPSGLKPASEAILSLHTHARTVPQSFLVADYNPDQAWER